MKFQMDDRERARYAKGTSLADILATKKEEGQLLPALESLKLVRQIADVLAAARDRFHDDLRPPNIIFQEKNAPILVEPELPQAVPAEDDSHDLLDYASPEQKEGKPASGRSNIYSLGIILYELLTGQRPQRPQTKWDIFERTTPAKEIPLESVRPGLTPQTYALVRKCLWHHEVDRFEDMPAMMAALDDAIAAEEAATPNPPRSAPVSRRWLYGGSAVIAILLCILGTFLFWRERAAGDGQTTRPVPTRPFQSVLSQPEDPAPTPSQTPAPTIAAATTVLSHVPIKLLGPLPNKEIAGHDSIVFAWSFASPLQPDQRFVLYLFSGNEPVEIGAVTAPVVDDQYRLQVQADQIIQASGTFYWQVTLQTTSSRENLVESALSPLILIVDTPTPAATATPPSATATPQSVADHTATALQPSTIFAAPDPDSEELEFVSLEEQVTVLGKSTNESWFFVRNQAQVEGFVAMNRFQWSFDLAALPVVTPAATPAQTVP